MRTYELCSLSLPEYKMPYYAGVGMIVVVGERGVVFANHARPTEMGESTVLEGARLVSRNDGLCNASAYELAQEIVCEAREKEGPGVLRPKPEGLGPGLTVEDVLPPLFPLSPSR